MEYFKLNGLSGYFLAVVLLLAIVAILGFCAVGIQKREASNYYNIDSKSAVMFDTNNAQLYHEK